MEARNPTGQARWLRHIHAHAPGHHPAAGESRRSMAPQIQAGILAGRCAAPPETGPTRPISLGDTGCRTMKTLGCSLQIDPGVWRQLQANILLPRDRSCAQDATQFGKQRTQRGVGGSGKAAWPQCLHEFRARRRSPPIGRQVDEQQPALASGKLLLDAPTIEPRGKPSAELDPRARQRHQGFAKVFRIPIRQNLIHPIERSTLCERSSIANAARWCAETPTKNFWPQSRRT